LASVCNSSNGERYTGYCSHPVTGNDAKTKTEARKIENLIKADIQKKLEAGEDTKEKEEPLPQAGFTLAEPISYYLKKLEGKSSFASAKGYADELLAFFGKETPMEDVEERIEDYIAFAKKQKVKYWAGKDKNGKDIFKERNKFRSAKTINEYLNFLVRSYRAFKKAPQNRKIKKYIPAPPEFEHLDVPARVPTPIPYNVARQYLDAFDEQLHRHTRLAYILCEQTGMRARECAQIRGAQYYESERRIYLNPEQTKSKRGRSVPINDIAHEALMECRKTGDYLWELLQEYPHLQAEYAEKYEICKRQDIHFILYRPKGTGVPRPVKHVATTAWKKTKEAVGINFRWHDTRAAFCTEVLGAGGDVAAVKQLAGHQDITTTQKYLYASDQRLRKSVEALASVRAVKIPNHKISKVSGKVLKSLDKEAEAA